MPSLTRRDFFNMAERVIKPQPVPQVRKGRRVFLAVVGGGAVGLSAYIASRRLGIDLTNNNSGGNLPDEFRPATPDEGVTTVANATEPRFPTKQGSMSPAASTATEFQTQRRIQPVTGTIYNYNSNAAKITDTPTPSATAKATETATATKQPLYWQCGRNYKENWRGYMIEGVDGRVMPTGLQTELRTTQGVKYASTLVCLEGVYQDSEYLPEGSAGLSILVWDKNGGAHRYQVLVGAVTSRGNISLGVSGNYRFYSPLEAVPIIERYTTPEAKTRQAVIDMAVSVNPPWGLSDIANRHSDINALLIEALRTGENFPDSPKDHFLWTPQITLLRSR